MPPLIPHPFRQNKLSLLDLFAGISDFSYGFERTGGFETVAFCETATFPRKIIGKHWPNVPLYDDVRELTADRLTTDGIHRVDAICGGFPCQDVSTGGLGAGIKEGTRSGLWLEYARLIRELKPRYVLIENVAVLRVRGLRRVLKDLSQAGYNCEWHTIPASTIGAPHRRDRLWILAYPQPVAGPLLTADHLEDALACGIGGCWQEEPPPRVAPPVTNGSVRLRALGNAVVPQIAQIIGRAILAHVTQTCTISTPIKEAA